MGGMTFAKPRPLLIEEIADLVDSFAHAAKVLYDAGADGAQLVRSLFPRFAFMSTADVSCLLR